MSQYGDTLPPMHNPRHQSAFYAGNPNHRHLFESEPTIRRGRSRPTAAQTDELRKLYDANPHPSKEEREALGARIGMYVPMLSHVRAIKHQHPISIHLGAIKA